MESWWPLSVLAHKHHESNIANLNTVPTNPHSLTSSHSRLLEVHDFHDAVGIAGIHFSSVRISFFGSVDVPGLFPWSPPCSAATPDPPAALLLIPWSIKVLMAFCPTDWISNFCRRSGGATGQTRQTGARTSLVSKVQTKLRWSRMRWNRRSSLMEHSEICFCCSMLTGTRKINMKHLC